MAEIEHKKHTDAHTHTHTEKYHTYVLKQACCSRTHLCTDAGEDADAWCNVDRLTRPFLDATQLPEDESTNAAARVRDERSLVVTCRVFNMRHEATEPVHTLKYALRPCCVIVLWSWNQSVNHGCKLNMRSKGEII